ncbi:hypothetical protein [Streptomyces sp. A1547]|uniref:hypothetical protein n=1 Tax=Streptomyces sp. A1547 TaxID=2563105 RepID=UPI00109E8AD0|nr:hypothetical protein [Streptomyces sp. A1547]THA30683.1 hypothetical protein E6W17_37425 [Streptomyces sp. A1547]
MLTLFLGTGCTVLNERPTAAPTGLSATPSATPSPAARDILLAQQFDLNMPGGAATPEGLESERPSPEGLELEEDGSECRADLKQLVKDRPDDHPRVWVTSPNGAAVTAGLGEVAVLCLLGFPPGPITVTVKAGGRTYTTAVKPVAEESEMQAAFDRLFNGRPMEVLDFGGGLLESGSWFFLPSEPALTDIARSGRFTVAARSGALRAESEVPLRLSRGAATMEGWERNHRIAVYGYSAGDRVPIGLYRPEIREDRPVYVLQQEVGRVVMPRHRVAVFTVPPDAFRTVTSEPSGDENAACLSIADLATCVT